MGARISTAAGPLEVVISSGMSEFDVQPSDGIRRAQMKDEREREPGRVAYVRTPIAGYGEEREYLTVNGVRYSADWKMIDQGGTWKLEGNGYPRLRREPWGDPTDAATRYAYEQLVPVVAQWLAEHPAEVAAMEADQLARAIEGIDDRIQRVDDSLQMMRAHKLALIEAQADAKARAER